MDRARHLAPLLLTTLLAACGGGGPGAAGPGAESGGNAASGGAAGGDVPAARCGQTPAAVDSSRPDTVVGDGTPASCTAAALQAALDRGGVITFDCGAGEHTLTVDTPLQVTRDAVLDGGNRITLSGGGRSRILVVQGSFERDTPHLTVQHLDFRDGLSDGDGSDTRQGGGAIFREGGALTVIDSRFVHNRAPASGQDVAGGALHAIGGGATVIVDSVFEDNQASNGGALGNLHNDLAIYRSRFANNAATGSGGNPGNGGNGGAIYIDGNGQQVTLCGVAVDGNRANAYGGGLFRVSNDGQGSQTIEQSRFDGNTVSTTEPSMGGGAYLQGMAIAIRASAFTRNRAGRAGGLLIGPGSTLQLENSTIAENTAANSLGGGIMILDGVTGRIRNVTIAANRAPDPLSFGGATAGGRSVVLQNSIIANNEAGNGYNPISCADPFLEGGGNIQYPVQRQGGGSDDPDSLCTPNTLVADPRLGPLGDHGGPTQTLLPAPDSPAHGLGADCPATDQRGQPRGEPCTSGAVEG